MHAPPRRLVLLGHPVVHSLSPRMHGAALARAGLTISYTAVDVEPAQLATCLEGLVNQQAAGNVTVPHKHAVHDLCDDLTPVAQRTEAVNTFWVEESRIRGDNTDVAGFDSAVGRLLGARPEGAIVLVIGAGGAASAVLAAVERWERASALVIGRNPESVRRLVRRYSDVAREATMPLRKAEQATLVVNATPIGLHDDAHPFPIDLLPAGATIVDLVYRPGKTAWIRAAEERGFRACDGLSMLVEQGALAFERWFGFPPDREVMWEAVSSV